MSESAPVSELSSLNLLLFTLGGVCFGVDAEQVEVIEAHFEGEPSDDIVRAHQLLGFGQAPVSYRAPVVLTIKSNCAPSYRIIIDAMEDIREYPWNAIVPFPALMEQNLLKQGIWGILQKNDRIVLLVDFQRMTDKAK